MDVITWKIYGHVITWKKMYGRDHMWKIYGHVITCGKHEDTRDHMWKTCDHM